MVQKVMLFEDISYLELWQPLCSTGKNDCANFVEGIMRNNSVKLSLIWMSSLGGKGVSYLEL